MTLAELAQALADRVDSVVPALLPNARRNGGYWSIGSVEGELGGSLFVHRAGERAGKWSDAATDEYGDVLDLIQLVRRLDPHGAREWAKAFIGVVEPRPVTRRDDGDEKAVADALRIWRESVPAAGTLVEQYLRSRAITLPPPPSLRFHPALPYAPTGAMMPALVAAVSGPDRRVHAVQRIFLRPDGSGKADVATPKMSRGPLRDGAVRLAPASAELNALGLAEGVETALSAMELSGIPVWAALGRRMDAIAIPDEVKRLFIFGDNGEPGIAAAERAADAHRRSGRSIYLRFPAADVGDFNDTLQAEMSVDAN